MWPIVWLTCALFAPLKNDSSFGSKLAGWLAGSWFASLSVYLSLADLQTPKPKGANSGRLQPNELSALPNSILVSLKVLLFVC